MRSGRSGVLLATLVVAALAACSGGGGGGGDDDPVASGLTAGFDPDASPACPGGADSLSLRAVSALGRHLTLGLQVTDCDSSLGVFGIVFDLSFDPSVVQCDSANPCAPGTLLTPPLAGGGPVCTCDNAAGEILGALTKQAPGTNDTIVPGGSRDIVLISLSAVGAGMGRLEFLGPGSLNGSALVGLDGGTPQPIVSLSTYAGGTATAQ